MRKLFRHHHRHSREGGNPVHVGLPGYKGSLDSRLRGNDDIWARGPNGYIVRYRIFSSVKLSKAAIFLFYETIPYYKDHNANLDKISICTNSKIA